MYYSHFPISAHLTFYTASMSSTNGQSVTGEEAIWARVLGDLDGPMDATAAKLVLGMKLPVKDRRRAYALGQKAQKREQSMVSDNQRCQAIKGVKTIKGVRYLYQPNAI